MCVVFSFKPVSPCLVLSSEQCKEGGGVLRWLLLPVERTASKGKHLDV